MHIDHNDTEMQYPLMCVLTTTSDFKRSSFAPLQPLNNGPEPLKWSLMEALMGGGTHSYSIFHPAIPDADGSKKMPLHTSFWLPRELCRPAGMRLRVIQIILGLTPHPFLICINTKQEQCGVKTNQGVWQAGSGWCLDLKISWSWHSETPTCLVFIDDHMLRQLESVPSLLLLQPSL